MIRPEDEKKINQMTVGLRLSKESSCILLVAFNDELHRRDVETELKRRLEPEEFSFRELRVTEDMYRNIPIVLVDMKPQPEDIFLIYDLKNALPEVLEYLNYRREDFVEHNISAIFWLDEPTLTKISRKALDFFAFRSLPVFEFHVDCSQEMVIPGRMTLHELAAYSSLEELNDKIALREEILNDYLEKRPEDRSTIGNLHNELGLLYASKSQFDEAIMHYEEALEASKKIKHRQGEASTLGNMGVVYDNKGDLDKALEYHSQALEIARRIGDVRGEASDLGNMGVVYDSKGDLGKALEYHDQALEIARRIGDVQGEAKQLGNMGNVYYSKGDLDKALEYYDQALEIDRRIGDVRGEAIQLGNMGLVYFRKGDLDKAMGYMMKSLRLLVSIGAALDAETTYGNLQITVERMKTVGMEISEEDRREIAELTEEYSKLKGKSDTTQPVNVSTAYEDDG